MSQPCLHVTSTNVKYLVTHHQQAITSIATNELAALSVVLCFTSDAKHCGDYNKVQKVHERKMASHQIREMFAQVKFDYITIISDWEVSFAWLLLTVKSLVPSLYIGISNSDESWQHLLYYQCRSTNSITLSNRSASVIAVTCMCL